MGKSRTVRGLLVAFATLSFTSCGEEEIETATQMSAPIVTTSKFLRAGAPIRGSYIVVLKDDAVPQRDVDRVAVELEQRHRATRRHLYEHALRGFSARLTEADAIALSADPRIKYIEEDGEAHILASGTQTNAPWNLDRIDQRNLPVNTQYVYAESGVGVHAYIVDTGIRKTHTQFGTRASYGWDAVDGDAIADDCHGHGTAVAGVVGSSTYGVAKSVFLHAVRVANCAGSASASDIVEGIDWITANHIKPAVANMSIGGVGGQQAWKDAIARAVAAGVTFVVAGGNSNGDACNLTPSDAPGAIAVAASTPSDARASYSSFGRCIALFAPGDNITIPWITSDTATATYTQGGTSLASPHVAGTAALYLELNATATPAKVRQVLTSAATVGKITSAGAASPNLLVYSAFNVNQPTGTLSIQGGAAYALSTSVTLTLSAIAGTTQMRFSNDGITWTAYQAYATTKAYTLPTGEGPKTVHVQFNGPSGTFNAVDSIVLDTLAPSATVRINNNVAYTAFQNVTLSWTVTEAGSGMADLAFSNDNVTFSAWEPYKISKVWMMTTGEGTKTVYVKFRDRAGRITTASDTIVRESVPPTGTVVINGGAASTSSPSVTLTLSAQDNLSGVGWMRFSNDGITYTAWGTYATSHAWALTAGAGTKTVRAQFSDGAGNFSAVVSDSIQLLVPTYTEITALSVTSITNDKQLAGVFAAEDDRTRIGWYANAASSKLIGIKPTRVAVYLKKSGAPTGTVEVCIRDAARNKIVSYGTKDVATLTTSRVLTTFTNDAAPTSLPSGMQLGFTISVEYTGGNSSNHIAAGTSYSGPVDGSNTVEFQYETQPGPGYSYVTNTSRDMGGKIYTSP